MTSDRAREVAAQIERRYDYTNLVEDEIRELAEIIQRALDSERDQLRTNFGAHYPSRCSLGALNCFQCGTSWPCEGAVKELQSRVRDPIEEYEEYERSGKGGE
jgi:hypothetical protein